MIPNCLAVIGIVLVICSDAKVVEKFRTSPLPASAKTHECVDDNDCSVPKFCGHDYMCHEPYGQFLGKACNGKGASSECGIYAYCHPHEGICQQRARRGARCDADYQCHGFCNFDFIDEHGYGLCETHLDVGFTCSRDEQCSYRCGAGYCEKAPTEFWSRTMDPILRNMLKPNPADFVINPKARHTRKSKESKSKEEKSLAPEWHPKNLPPTDFKPVDPIFSRQTVASEHKVLRLSGYRRANDTNGHAW